VAETIDRRDIIDAHFAHVYSVKTPLIRLHSANPTRNAAVM
jgi:hypothetical protein